jgi:hypothetical protein
VSVGSLSSRAYPVRPRGGLTIRTIGFFVGFSMFSL